LEEKYSSRTFRYSIIAGAALLLGFIMSQRSKKSRLTQKLRKAENKSDPAKNNDSALDIGQAVIPEAPTGARYAYKHDEEHRVWKWLKRLGIVAGIAYAVITYFMYCANRDSADAAKKAADTAASQLELTERPWVDADVSLEGPLTFNVNGGTLPIKITLRNSGHSPAQNTSVSVLPLMGSETIKAAGYRPKACQNAVVMMQQAGITLFPGINLGQQNAINFNKDDIEKFKASKEFPGSNFSKLPDAILSPSFLVCIVYKPTFNGASLYHTSYIFDLYKKLPATNVMFKIGEDVPQDNLLLRFGIFKPIEAD
jgi:hypothetical protein